MQRREAAQRNLNRENAVDRPAFNERILRCFCSKLLPKAQTELATSQSIIEKNSNQVNLIRKRQLSTQISNESNRSRNSRESGHYSSRTVSLYEDFTANDKNDSSITKPINLPSIENGNLAQSVYIGSPQRRRMLELEEWKALNNRSLALDQSLDKEKGVGNQESTSKQEVLSNSDPYFQGNHNDQLNNLNKEEIHNSYAFKGSLKKLDSLSRIDSLNKLAELNANNLLINERLEKLNLDKIKNENNDKDDNQTLNQQNKALDHQYLDNINEFMNRPPEDKPADQSNSNENNHIKFKNIDEFDKLKN